MSRNMRQFINQKGLDLIKSFEGLYLKAYICPAGVLTIGFGHTGPDVKPDMAITEEEAEDFLKMDIMEFEVGVNKLVRIPLSSNQFSALVSFAFNVGLGNLQKSTLLKDLNKGAYESAANWFLRWVRANGKELPGLIRRRKAERELFLTPDYEENSNV